MQLRPDAGVLPQQPNCNYIVSSCWRQFCNTFKYRIFTVVICSVLLAVLDPRVGHTMDVLFPFLPVLCHSDWHGESCPRLDVVHPGRVWSSSPACSRAPGIVPYIISFSRQLRCFLMVWPEYASFLALTVSNSSLFTPALLWTHSDLFSLLSIKLAFHIIRKIVLLII